MSNHSDPTGGLLLGIGAGLLVFYRGFRQFREYKLVSDTPRINIRSVPMGFVHVMVVPYAHLDELQKLPAEPAAEMMALTQRIEGVLRTLYRPDGINLGMNIGKAAGAGIAGHIHMHVLPRWVADANFMSVVGEVRVLPETLDVTWKKIRDALA